MPNTHVTVTGNVVGDPELRFTPNGVAVASFRLASTPQVFNRSTNEWEEQETMWFDVTAWRQAAHNVAESLAKGLRVVVVGQLRVRSWDDRQHEGVRRTAMEIEAEEIAPSIRFATAKVAKNAREQDTAPAAASRPVSAVS